jgi:hypothetical protein
MSMLCCTAALIVSTIAPAIAQDASRDSNPPPGYVEIDGSRTPEKIPQYEVWRRSLRTLAEAHRKDLKWMQESLPVAAEDATAIYAEALAQQQRDDRCWARQEARKVALLASGADHDAAYNGLKPIVLACREEVIAARDRLLAALSDEGRAALTLWVDQRRAGMRILVPKQDLEFFTRPQ